MIINNLHCGPYTRENEQGYAPQGFWRVRHTANDSGYAKANVERDIHSHTKRNNSNKIERLEWKVNNFFWYIKLETYYQTAHTAIFNHLRRDYGVGQQRPKKRYN